MTRYCVALGLLLMSSGAVAEGAKSYIMPPEKGPQLLEQCSREAPRGIKSFFAPEVSEVADLEKQLIPYLIRVRPNINFQEYSRQYIGFMMEGKRYIYGNFFKNGPWITRPASQPVDICDGGDSFWGIVYSLESKTFKDLHTNGVA